VYIDYWMQLDILFKSQILFKKKHLN